jgi:polynucleotide 5'-kinase involved in rRNA processing
VADQSYRSLRERLRDVSGTLMLIGAPDTGKTTLGKLLAQDALAAGESVAYVDGDVAAATVGPPACAGMRQIRSAADLESGLAADELRFVGSTSPQGVVLPHVVAVASLVEIARDRADTVILDTTSVVAGVVGQTLKYHLWETVRPDLVIAIERGEELEPIVGMLRRFLSARIAMAEPLPDVVPSPATERHSSRIEAFAGALAPPLQRWRVQTTVFAPTLPEGFDLSRLHGMLVGVQDDKGRCLGLGALEHADGVVRVATHHGDEMRGLRLGSMRIDLETFTTQRVRLRQLIFGI